MSLQDQLTQHEATARQKEVHIADVKQQCVEKVNQNEKKCSNTISQYKSEKEDAIKRWSKAQEDLEACNIANVNAQLKLMKELEELKQKLDLESQKNHSIDFSRQDELEKKRKDLIACQYQLDKSRKLCCELTKENHTYRTILPEKEKHVEDLKTIIEDIYANIPQTDATQVKQRQVPRTDATEEDFETDFSRSFYLNQGRNGDKSAKKVHSCIWR